jgi:hypothetical protein
MAYLLIYFSRATLINNLNEIVGQWLGEEDEISQIHVGTSIYF